jgi:hypothetical protein
MAQASKEAQLEIAAQWLEEGAMLLSELNRSKEATNLRRVAKDCERLAKAA